MFVSILSQLSARKPPNTMEHPKITHFVGILEQIPNARPPRPLHILRDNRMLSIAATKLCVEEENFPLAPSPG